MVENLTEENIDKLNVITTSQLVDDLEILCCKEDISDEHYAKINKIRKELLTREPFCDFVEQIENLTTKLEGMQKAIDKIKRHEHNSTGKILVPL